jgi:hypothetical protein
MEEQLKAMNISGIAAVIKNDWKNVHYAAVPYLEAMESLDKITDDYICDSGVSVVLYFLCNANSWRGEVARAVKKELNARCKTK